MTRAIAWVRGRVGAWLGRDGGAAACPVGRLGEDAAAAYLRARGFRVLARNVIVPMGEADLVCEDPEGVIVLVEVKARVTPAGRGKSRAIRPEAAVHRRKAAKLLAIAAYLRRRNGWMDRPARVDVVAVRWEGAADGPPAEIRHFPNAVRG